ncbi:MAG TPA: STAS domain-containing protein [Candidatus Cybelea sp.]|nr:STAS domain-containing protein [Candidatus Cybelea sp.]
MKPYVFGNNAYAVLDGELDVGRKAEICAAMPDPAAVKSAVISLARATYIDSFAMGILVGFRREFMKHGGDPQNVFLILPKDGPIRRAFDSVGLNRLFSVAYAEPTLLVHEHIASSPSKHEL